MVKRIITKVERDPVKWVHARINLDTGEVLQIRDRPTRMWYKVTFRAPNKEMVFDCGAETDEEAVKLTHEEFARRDIKNALIRAKKERRSGND
jgi:hypothetical protein